MRFDCIHSSEEQLWCLLAVILVSGGAMNLSGLIRNRQVALQKVENRCNEILLGCSSRSGFGRLEHLESMRLAYLAALVV